MEFFSKTRAVKLKSHMNKYLIADEDRWSTRQSRNGVTLKARWLVEIVDSDRHVIRLKSCYNRYLTASGDPFLFGMTGHKILQTSRAVDAATIEWRPIRDGFQVKLQSHGRTYLRANGGTQPWRNSVTHVVPIAAATRNYWILWDVEAVELPEDEAAADCISRLFPISEEIPSLESRCHFRSALSLRSWFSRSVSAVVPCFTTDKVRALCEI